MANWAPKINNTYNFFGCCTIIRSTIFDGDCRIYPKRRFWWEIYERYKILFWDKSTFSSFRLSRNVSFQNISKMYCTRNEGKLIAHMRLQSNNQTSVDRNYFSLKIETFKTLLACLYERKVHACVWWTMPTKIQFYHEIFLRKIDFLSCEIYFFKKKSRKFLRTCCDCCAFSYMLRF